MYRYVNHLSWRRWIAGLGVVSGLVTRGKRACHVCVDNLTFIVSLHLNKKSIHHLDSSCHLHTNGENHISIKKLKVIWITISSLWHRMDGIGYDVGGISGKQTCQKIEEGWKDCQPCLLYLIGRYLLGSCIQKF